MGEVMVLRNGMQMVETFAGLRESDGAAPCAILLDSVMRPLSQQEVCEAIESLPRHIPLILISGAKASPIPHPPAGLRLAGVLEKPITPEELQDCLRKFCPLLVPR